MTVKTRENRASRASRPACSGHPWPHSKALRFTERGEGPLFRDTTIVFQSTKLAATDSEMRNT